MIAVVVAGGAGRMGRLAVEALSAADDIEVVGTIGRNDDAPAVLAAAAPDVLVDFTVAAASTVLGMLAAERGVNPVIGTSGHTPDQVDQLTSACARAGVGGLLVPNFSLGAVLQMRFAEAAARHLEAKK